MRAKSYGDVGMWIKGLPEYIVRDRAIELVNSLGIDPNQLRKLEYGTSCIRIEYFALDPEGHPYMGIGDEAAINVIHIPIVETEPSSMSTDSKADFKRFRDKGY